MPASRRSALSARMPQLDGVRALAAVAVVLSHAFDEQTTASLVLGRTAVRLFFVLSGFLITLILLRTRSKQQATTAAPRVSLGNFRFRLREEHPDDTFPPSP